LFQELQQVLSFKKLKLQDFDDFVARSSLYYKSRKDVKDKTLKKTINKVLSKHKSYGHRRIALELNINKKRVLRVMNKYNIKPYRRRTKKLVKKQDLNQPDSGYQNLIKGMCPLAPNIVWVTDFTYIKFKGSFVYLSTVIDVYTREVKGYAIGTRHNAELVVEAVKNAINKNDQVLPLFIHSDQGSEYRSELYITFIEDKNITISMSSKSSPWENSKQEAFYSNFKLDMGDFNRFETLGELIAEIHQHLHYYNNQRIQIKLKTSPYKFKLKYLKQAAIFEEKVFEKQGT
jgi:transposase InsO family protein